MQWEEPRRVALSREYCRLIRHSPAIQMSACGSRYLGSVLCRGSRSVAPVRSRRGLVGLHFQAMPRRDARVDVSQTTMEQLRFAASNVYCACHFMRPQHAGFPSIVSLILCTLCSLQLACCRGTRTTSSWQENMLRRQPFPRQPGPRADVDMTGLPQGCMASAFISCVTVICASLLGYVM